MSVYHAIHGLYQWIWHARSFRFLLFTLSFTFITSCQTDYSFRISGDVECASLQALRNLASANDQFKIGDYKEAVKLYTQAIQKAPRCATIYFGRGKAYYKLAAFDQAIADYTHAVELKPDFAEAFLLRGTAYSESGNFDQAIADYTHAIELKPDYDRAFYGRGRVYLIRNEISHAKDDFTQAIALSPEFAEAYLGRAYAYFYQGENDLSRADLQHYVRITGKEDDPVVLALLTQIQSCYDESE